MTESKEQPSPENPTRPNIPTSIKDVIYSNVLKPLRTFRSPLAPGGPRLSPQEALYRSRLFYEKVADSLLAIGDTEDQVIAYFNQVFEAQRQSKKKK